MTMSQRDTSGTLDPFELCQELHRAGWDAFASDLAGEVAARRDPAPGRGKWNLVIDRGGRWRFSATQETGIANGRELVRGGHTFRLLKEQQQVLTVAGRLDSVADLPALLAELTRLALEESRYTRPTAEGEAIWREDPELRA
jgi:hypothetical protein